MDKEKNCKKIPLAGSGNCHVVYCEACCVAEVTIGAVSVRLDIKSLNDLQSMLASSLIKLDVLKATTVSADFDYQQLNLH